MSYLIDVNVWVALAVGSHVHHNQAVAWFDDVPIRGAAFCRVTQMGVLRLLTNRQVMGDDVLPMSGAWGIYDALRGDERVFFAEEPAGLEECWRLLCSDQPPSGNRWTDLYLAGFAGAANMHLVTFDRRFRLLPALGVTLLAEP